MSAPDEGEATYLVRVFKGANGGVRHANESGLALCIARHFGVTSGAESSRGTWTELGAKEAGVDTDLCSRCQRAMGEVELYAFICGVSIRLAMARCKAQEELLRLAIPPPRAFAYAFKF